MERRPSVRKAWGSSAHVDQPLDHPATEFSSAMALKELVAMEATDFAAAAKLCDASGAPLHAGDALHLSVCRRVSGQGRCCRGVQIRLSGGDSASPDLF